MKILEKRIELAEKIIALIRHPAHCDFGLLPDDLVFDLQKALHDYDNFNEFITRDACYTCRKPYKVEGLNVCSSSFHCCRDCEWSNFPYGGKLLKQCDECKKYYNNEVK